MSCKDIHSLRTKKEDTPLRVDFEQLYDIDLHDSTLPLPTGEMPQVLPALLSDSPPPIKEVKKEDSSTCCCYCSCLRIFQRLFSSKN